MREKSSLDRDLRIANIVGEYEAALDRGETPSVDAILSANQDIAGELQEQLEMAGLLIRTSAGLSSEQKQGILLELERDISIEQEMQSPEYQKKRDEASHRILAKIMTEYEKLYSSEGRLKDSKSIAKIGNQSFLPVERRQDVFLLLLFLGGRHNEMAEEIWGTLRFAKNLFYIGMKTSIRSIVRDYYDYQAEACGPFTDEIYKDIRNLKQGGLITDDPPRQKKVTGSGDINIAAQPARVSAVYKLTEKGVTIAEKLYAWAKLHNPELLQEMARIKIRLADMTPEQMVQEIEKEYPEYTKFCKLLKKEINSGG